MSYLASPKGPVLNCVYEECLLMSDFNSDMLVFHHCIPRKACPRIFFLLRHGNLPILAANRQMHFEATPIFLAKMSYIPNGFRCLQRLVRCIGSVVVSNIRNLFIRMLTKDIVLYRRKSRAIGSVFSRFTKLRRLEVEINSNLVCAIRPAKYFKSFGCRSRVRQELSKAKQVVLQGEFFPPT
jgi:hypothetical protein